METNPQLRFPQNGIFLKKNFEHFLLAFFRFFSKNCEKVKVTNLTKNEQNYQILLETYFLETLGIDSIKLKFGSKNVFLTTRFIAETFFSNKTCG